MLGEEAIGQLSRTLAAASDETRRMVDDIVKATKGGHLPLKQAMSLLVQIPADQLGPEIERLEKLWTEQLPHAILSGNAEMEASLNELPALLAQFETKAEGATDAATKYAPQLGQSFGGGGGARNQTMYRGNPPSPTALSLVAAVGST